jgi:RND family efflux transporter MFP subunit
VIRKIVLTIALVGVLAACQKKEAPVAAKVDQSLPADVQSVASTANIESTTATSATVTTTTSSEVTPTSEGSLSLTGEFISPHTSELAAKIQGRVARVLADEGERVTSGQPLLVLESDYATIEAQRATADLARATSAVEDARRDFARKTELKAKGSVPQATYDRSQAAYEQAQASRAAASATLSSARQRIADSTVRSPFTGVVVERRADTGERLGDNSVAFVVAQTSPLKLRFTVPERYLSNVRRGDSVVAKVDPYPGEQFEGKVNVIAQVVDARTRSFFVEALFPNSDGRLRPGLFARVVLDIK